MSYYIKQIFPPYGQLDYPEDGFIEFSKRSVKKCGEFAEKCEGFLLYETTTHRNTPEIGAGAIYAYGNIISNPWPQIRFNFKNEDDEYPFAVKAKFDNMINSTCGVPLFVIRKILGPRETELRGFCRGGLLEITKKEFNQLRGCLDSNNELEILIIGLDDVGIKNALYSRVLKERGINRDNIDIKGYKEARNIGVQDLQPGNHRGILVGQNPHNTKVPGGNLLRYLRHKRDSCAPFAEAREERGPLHFSLNSIEKALSALRRKIWERECI